MKIAVIGATGFVGRHLVAELAHRGHEVLGLARQVPAEAAPGVRYQALDVRDTPALAAALHGQDAVLSAFNAGWDNPAIYDDFLAGSLAIEAAVRQAGGPRYLVVGGAGSLLVAEGVQALDAPGFEVPPQVRAGSSAARDYLTHLRGEQQLDWAFFSPPFEMHAGVDTGRTGHYRLGTDYPVANAEGRSILSGEDLAVVLADELETPRHHRTRFTAAY